MDAADSIPEEFWEGMDAIERAPTLWYMALGASMLSGLILWVMSY